MKTAQVFQDKIVVKEMNDERLNGRKGAILKVLGCGLCGSDIVKFQHKIVHDGAVLGHEIVAQIVEINSSLPSCITLVTPIATELINGT